MPTALPLAAAASALLATTIVKGGEPPHVRFHHVLQVACPTEHIDSLPPERLEAIYQDFEATLPPPQRSAVLAEQSEIRERCAASNGGLCSEGVSVLALWRLKMIPQFASFACHAEAPTDKHVPH